MGIPAGDVELHPAHWMQPVSWSVHQVMDSIIPGALIVLHDGHGHGRHVAEIVDTIIPRVRSLGFEFVTVDEMQRQRSETASEIEEEEVTI